MPSHPLPEFEKAPNIAFQEINVDPKSEPEVEIPLFVPQQPKASRRVRFHVTERVALSPNPILPKLGE